MAGSYVDYWEQRKVVDPDNVIWQPRPKKIRKRRKYSEESIQRMLKRKGKDGKPKWRDPEEEERKRQHKAMNDVCYERTMEKQRLAKEKLRSASVEPRALEGEVKTAASLLLQQRTQSPGIGLQGYGRYSSLSGMYITVNGTLHILTNVDAAIAAIEDGNSS
ncbi:MAG: hypothetical protein J7621_00970 [Niastella sp.]|nr:hypothetical protein [Niastella sp.]